MTDNWITENEIDMLLAILEKSRQHELHDCEQSVHMLLLQCLEIELYEVAGADFEDIPRGDDADIPNDNMCFLKAQKILTGLKKHISEVA